MPSKQLACLVTAAAVAALAAPASAASTFTFPADKLNQVGSTAVVEASGLFASPNNPGVFWTENDSGNPNTIYAISSTGQFLGSYNLPGATNIDWEDLTIGAGPVAGVSYIYLPTIGSGKSGGTTLTRIPEPSVSLSQAASPVSRTLTGAQTISVSVPTTDGESLFIDPANGDTYIGSKQSGSTPFYRVTQAQLAAATTLVPAVGTLAGTVPLSLGNGANISYDGNSILVRNQNNLAYLYHRTPGQTITQALTNVPDALTINGKSVESNAEAIAFDNDANNFYTISEGSQPFLYRYDRTSNDAPAAHTTILGQNSTYKYIAGGAAPGSGWQNAGFNDAAWASGSGILGYGTQFQNTTIASGSSAYFRTTFNVSDLSADGGGLTLKLLFDDGAAVYLNGTQIALENLSPDATNSSFALSAQDASLHDTWYSITVDPSLLLLGANTLAVETHSASALDTDMQFDAQLIGLTPEPTALSFISLAVGSVLMRRRRTKH